MIGTSTSAAGAKAIGDYLAAAEYAGKGAMLEVNDGAAIDALVAEIEKEFGAVGILVNNAGITQDNLAMRMKEDEWDAVIDTDLKSVFRLSRAVLRGMMKARAGRIINITSVVGSSRQCRADQLCRGQGRHRRPVARAGAGDRQPQHHRQLRRAGLHRHRHDARIERAAARRRSSAGSRSARLGTAEDVAAAVVFLASPQAGYITGATLHVNGGMYMA